MYLLPCEIFQYLYVLLPMTLIVYRWRHPVDAGTLTMACAVASWLFFNTLMVLDPPDNGLGNVACFLTCFVMGWLWMLPLLWFLLFLDSAIRRLGGLPLMERMGEILYKPLAGVSILVTLWGLMGWMSGERAIEESRKELAANDCKIVGPAAAVFADGGWIVRYPESGFKEIRLYRNGGMQWIGGPG